MLTGFSATCFLITLCSPGLRHTHLQQSTNFHSLTSSSSSCTSRQGMYTMERLTAATDPLEFCRCCRIAVTYFNLANLFAALLLR